MATNRPATNRPKVEETEKTGTPPPGAPPPTSPADDVYARQSFTFRRMQPWQIWAVIIAVIVFFVVVFAWL